LQEQWFLDINPNGRIPALTDTFEDGKAIRLFESGSIMQYLVERYDKDYKISYPYGSREYWEVNNWVSQHLSVVEILRPSAEYRNSYSGRWADWAPCKVN
jgi:glutathione S-transferase